MTKINTDLKKIEEILCRNTTHIIPKNNLLEQLKSGNQLRIKFGIDPTGKRIHFGRAATLMKLRDFQLLGHKIVLIIGDFTALVGDASDKTKERPMLKKEDVTENLKNYLDEIGRIIDISQCEIRYNSEWLGKLDFNDIAELANNFSVAEMLDRENFSKRYNDGIRISLREFLYPLMQGYDSVMVDSDVELGGNDQLFNCLAGRTLQKAFGKKEQSVIGTKLMNGTNGEKMSTSIGNCVYVDEPANEMFGKIMSITDSVMLDYFEFLTRVDIDEAKKKIAEDPRNAKVWLAREIVTFYHSKEEAEKANQEFDNIFQKGGKPDKIPEMVVGPNTKILDMIAVMMENNKSDARRMLDQKAVSFNGEKIDEEFAKSNVVKNGDELRVGKRKWAKILIKNW